LADYVGLPIVEWALEVTTLDYYDKHAPEYAAKGMSEKQIAVLENFAALLPTGGKVLDLGSGGGHASKWLIDHGYDVTMVDGSAGLAAEAEKLTSQPVGVLSFDELDYEEAFDGIWASASLLHVPQKELPSIWPKVHRALEKGGVLHASFKELEADMVDGLGRFYGGMNADLLKSQLTENGFEILEFARKPGRGRDGVEVHFLIANARRNA